MSLYVGHLSPHVRREELEVVFQRFGRCSVQLKDGYGFAVYEVTANAERALRALRGKKICGEQISLNWSNRQPRPFQRPARSTRFYEPYRERNFREGNGRVGIRGSQAQRGFSTGAACVTMYSHGGRQLDNAPDKEAGHMHEDINDIRGDKGVNLKERVMDEGATDDLNPIENDRWGEPGNHELTGNGIENGDDFDRYEPYHGYNRSNVDENNQMASSYGTPDRGSSQDKRGREHSVDDDSERNLDKSKPQQTCYNCGLVGHIMRNCPQGDAWRERFGKFNYTRDENFRDKGEGRLKRFRPSSWGRPDASRDPLISRHHMRVRKEPRLEKARRASRTSEASPKIQEKRHSKLRGDSREKKRSKLEHEAPRKAVRGRRRRRYHTSSLSSDSSTTSSQSHSLSPRSISNSGSRSCSRTASSRSPSVSSSSRAASLSSNAKSARSRSRSSFPKSLSLSDSLDRKTTPSPKNKQTDVCMNTSLKGDVEAVMSPESKHLGIAKPKVTCSTVDENAVTPFKADGGTNGEHIGSDGDDAQYSTFHVDYGESNTCADLHKDIVVSYESHRQNNDLQEVPSAKLNKHIPSKSETSKSTKITTQEMFLVLQHYGLAAPEEDRPDISVEEYFGAARLWPWEVIYYRRLKKGPISTENYARRLEQNNEFGIVDKYIRSSSGWGECSQNDK